MRDRYLRKLQIKLVDGEFDNPINEQIRDPSQVYGIFRDIKDKSQETLLGLYLSENQKANVYSVLSVGSSHEALCSPEEIFRHAYLTSSKTFVLIHNHPGGDPSPSENDREVIRILERQSKILNFRFLDFIIVGKDVYWSLFEETMEGGEYALGRM